ncbi:GNAT family N-acetyltransferase [Paralimibaculum aggregatum]|uniref:GNAT family N-acetyltransferase n=1 Tax=Paralimibaculum aggregatum TaxID=3036245 RepID=A0ABQ6LK68_9RHOB|nr:GNAT family N-acetyltransferase [Limibaculum sp. NKW23]GMG82811.1 GNAT family N-acetyltransferase [Limibaculum sp. NKW23]
MFRRTELLTPRLRLRGWREEDLVPFARLNADPEVMAHLGGPLARQESDMIIGRFLEKWLEEPAFGWWALEVRGDGGFIGFVGLNRPDFTAPPAPCVEIGWRLARDAWGQGYATEAARACLDHGFGTVGLDEILSFTVPSNTRSRAVMERIGMQRDAAGDFDHPLVKKENPLRRHLLYRIRRDDWQGADG